MTDHELADVWADQGPFLLVRMSRRCGSRDGVDAVVAETVRSLADRPCPPEGLAPELLARACAGCAASPVCARARRAAGLAGDVAPERLLPVVGAR